MDVDTNNRGGGGGGIKKIMSTMVKSFYCYL